jgi:predicted phosphodiesterase
MPNNDLQNTHIITRRDFLRLSSFILTGLTISPKFAFSQNKKPDIRVKFGIVTDSHYADSDPKGNRYFRESISKMEECVEFMNQVKVDFLIELGDFKDQDTPPNKEYTILYLQKIETLFQQFNGPKYHVIGNHDLDSISKDDFSKIAHNTNIPGYLTFYSFDLKNIHFVVLDANFKSDQSDYKNGNFDWRDTNISYAEMDWLKKDLKSTNKPVIVFIHQQLDCEGDLCVNNADEVRNILDNSSKAIAVIQGHNHNGDYSQIKGIHYYTLKAMVDGSGSRNNSYAIVEVFDDGSISITGYRKAVTKKSLLPSVAWI